MQITRLAMKLVRDILGRGGATPPPTSGIIPSRHFPNDFFLLLRQFQFALQTGVWRTRRRQPVFSDRTSFEHIGDGQRSLAASQPQINRRGLQALLSALKIASIFALSLFAPSVSAIRFAHRINQLFNRYVFSVSILGDLEQ